MALRASTADENDKVAILLTTDGRDRFDYGARSPKDNRVWRPRVAPSVRLSTQGNILTTRALRQVVRRNDMKIVVKRCCGLDVHKRTVVACVLILDERGRVHKETRTFGTTTPELMKLLDWLTECGCTQVAMESTGVYWKPVYNLLEGVIDVMVVNAQHMKNVPGRKTDVNDAEWIAELVQCGLLRASFIPPQPLRELRELVRYRKSLVQNRSAEVNRVQKFLEGANVKLSSVATNVMGVSGRAMLKKMVEGEENPETLAALAKGKLKAKTSDLQKALTGRMNDHHRFLLKRLLDHVEFLDERVAECDQEIEKRMEPQSADVERLTSIPGVGVDTARLILAEIGPDMSRFPTHKHLASWAGLCPGNNESAGKRKSGKTRKGSKWLNSGLCEAAKAVARTKKNFLTSLYYRVKARKGPNKATVAVAHAILVIAYHLLKNGTTYEDLGPNFLDQLNRERVAHQLKRRLESLGYEVTVQDGPGAPPAA